MLQISRSPAVADVVVIGSGAGTVTHVLANMGINVTLLEAGPNIIVGKAQRDPPTTRERNQRKSEPGTTVFGSPPSSQPPDGVAK